MQNIIARKYFLWVVVITLFIELPNVSAEQYRSDLQLIGQGSMSWFFIDLYDAELYSKTGQYQLDQFPQALNITYQKNITKQDLLSATEKQWQQLGVNEQQALQWLSTLNTLWPNIKKGDQLLFRVEMNGDGYFYHNQQPLGGIKDKQFSSAFLSIWLSPNTSEPALRKQLIEERK